MAAIARTAAATNPTEAWHDIAHLAAKWCTEHDVAPAGTIVLVPFAQHLPLLRHAWGERGGWMPRIETTQTLARSLGPPPARSSGDPTFDPAVDRLSARQLLLADPFGATWAARDPRGFDHAIVALVKTAHSIAQATAAVPPDARPEQFATARGLLAAAAGPGAVERTLARFALEWVASAAASATDRLFDLRPSAWVVVQAGGPDALALAVSLQAECPSLVIDADTLDDAPFATAMSADANVDVAVAVCADFEDEARHCAAEILARLSAGAATVALIAQDRVLVRRVRALLARQDVPLRDETGWKLDTTRAGARVAGLLRSAETHATTDTWLAWIKDAVDVWPGVDMPKVSLAQIETRVRRQRYATVESVPLDDLPPLGQGLWLAAGAIVAGLRARTVRDLRGWLAALREALDACGLMKRLYDDEAGRQLIPALHLDDPAISAGDSLLTFDDFTRWVDDALESASFLPEAPIDAAVVVTPLERAMLRPFDAVVFPGCDHKRLGSSPSPHPLLDDATAVALGLPGNDARRAGELKAFVQMLRAPHVTFLRRQDDDGEPLAASPLLARLEAARLHAGRGPIPASIDPFVDRPVSSTPTEHPRPSAPRLLPKRLSASACEALRACPYRFHALHMLRLREPEELDDEVEKRDYGTWLHAVLEKFHATRDVPPPPDATLDLALITRIAGEERARLRLDEAGFLPYAATFARFAPRYLDWLHGRDDDGAQWLESERQLTVAPAAWGGIEMYGVIDRIDSAPGEDGPVTQLIDYKTGSATALRDKVRRPQEDTQLAFYAALMAGQSEAGGAVDAMYLAIDDGDRITPIPHEDVEATADWLVEGVGRDLANLRIGAPMLALGEGRTCDFCEARGLCRRDDWTGA